MPSGRSSETQLQEIIERNRTKALQTLDRLAYEQNQLEFTQKFFQVREGNAFICAPYHAVIAGALNDVFAGKITRLLINIPPGYTKTQMCVIDFVARGLALNPKARFIHASYSESLVSDNSMAIKDTVLSPEYQALWNIALRPDARAKGLWKTRQGGGFLARPAGGAITGFRAGRMEAGFTGALIIDDPLKPDDAERLLARSNVNRRWDTTFKSRLAREDIPVIVIMQRLHRDDLSGYLLRGGSGDIWDHLCLPVLIERGGQKRYSHGRALEHGLEAGPLWPGKHGPDHIHKLRLDSYTFAAQYMQRPSVRGGALFKKSWLHDYKIHPDLEYRMIFADTAQKTGQEHDYSVFQCWGKEHAGNKLYLLDQIRGRWEEPDLIEVALKFWDKHASIGQPVRMGQLRAMAIEDKVSGTSLIQHLNRHRVPVRAIPRHRDKITRARNVAPTMNNGIVHVPKKADWYGEYEVELLSFPKGVHDDQVDPTIDAITEMSSRGMSMTDLYRNKNAKS
ncbi:MAG: phage terminase large subunit [Hellea sp.]|nr:phage terminase large subunit [Hellea sp.]